jgi:membrane protein DedA with SNARE-associated domain
MDSLALQLAGIFFLTWLSEDAAVLGGAVAAASGSLPLIPCLLACFAGVWSGDIILFLVARHGGRPFAERFFGKGAGWSSKIEKGEAWFLKRGILALVISRFIPGMRLTTFLAAGFLRMNGLLFTMVTGIMAAAWSLLIFAMVSVLGEAAPSAFHALKGHLLLIMAGALLILGGIHLLPRVLRWLTRWEFWPAWVFYTPVAFKALSLAIKHRSIVLPSCANPGMKTGGLIGDSKAASLSEISAHHPEYVANTLLIPPGEERMTQIHKALESGAFAYPFILKPDVGQRGAGFQIIRDKERAKRYVSTFPAPLVMQEYLPGPLEAGIFYHRHPEESEGHILAITWKEFPSIIGDGMSTLSQLILNDSRASLIAGTYLRRFVDRTAEIIPEGKVIRLVEAGNHCQGCIFRDGTHRATPALVTKIDELSKSMNGFFIGRYDVRFADEEAFARGEDFKILEVNGAAAEATAAYDGDKNLGDAYHLLFIQWDLVFEIGAANRKLGHQPDSIGTILTEWRRYSAQSRFHPVTD